MTNTARQIRLLAETLDYQGKVDTPIVVIGTRPNLRPEFKPCKRGGPLMCGGHELRLVKRERPGELLNMDWIEEC